LIRDIEIQFVGRGFDECQRERTFKSNGRAGPPLDFRYDGGGDFAFLARIREFEGRPVVMKISRRNPFRVELHVHHTQPGRDRLPLLARAHLDH
jgi:hypothetical protein